MQSSLRARHRLSSAQHALLRVRAVNLTRHWPPRTASGRPRLLSDRRGDGAGGAQHGSNGATRSGGSSTGGGMGDGGGIGGRRKPGGEDGPASTPGGGGGAAGSGTDGQQGGWAFVERMGKAAEEAEASTAQRLQERLHVLGDVINARSHHQREDLQRLFKQILDARSRRLAAAVAGVLVLVGGAMFFNRHRAREVVKDELSHAASGALGGKPTARSPTCALPTPAFPNHPQPPPAFPEPPPNPHEPPATNPSLLQPSQNTPSLPQPPPASPSLP